MVTVLLLAVQLMPLSLLLCFLVVADVKSFPTNSRSGLGGDSVVSSAAHKTALIMLIALYWGHLRAASTNPAHYYLTLVWLFNPPIRVESLRFEALPIIRIVINASRSAPSVVKVVRRHCHLYISFSRLLRTTAANCYSCSCPFISIRVLLVVVVVMLVPVIYIRLLVLHWGTLVVRCHVLACVVWIRQFYTPIVISLQAWLFIEGVFETHTIVRHVSLLAAINQLSSYTLWNLIAVRSDLISTIRSCWVILKPSRRLQRLVRIRIEVLECLPQVYELSAIASTRLHGEMWIIGRIVIIGRASNFEFEFGLHHLLILHFLLRQVIPILVPVFFLVDLFFLLLILLILFIFLSCDKWVTAANSHRSSAYVEVVSADHRFVRGGTASTVAQLFTTISTCCTAAIVAVILI